jgi:hypothetical protein
MIFKRQEYFRYEDLVSFLQSLICEITNFFIQFALFSIKQFQKYSFLELMI